MQDFPVEMLGCTLQTQGSCMPNELIVSPSTPGATKLASKYGLYVYVVQSLKKKSSSSAFFCLLTQVVLLRKYRRV